MVRGIIVWSWIDSVEHVSAGKLRCIHAYITRKSIDTFRRTPGVNLDQQHFKRQKLKLVESGI